MTTTFGTPGAYGLYRPEFEHDACGIGALANIRGVRTHQMLSDALSVLLNMDHRGGAGLEPNTGDGAGILFQTPHRFFRKEAQKCGCLLPDEGDYGVAMLFLPRDPELFAQARELFEQCCNDVGLPVLFWREVPVDAHDLGVTARACQPRIWQAFMVRPASTARGEEFERALYLARRSIEKRAHGMGLPERDIFYVCSMSARTIVYKGMLLAGQLRTFYLDLSDATIETAIALVHSRYSTNTTPSAAASCGTTSSRSPLPRSAPGASGSTPTCCTSTTCRCPPRCRRPRPPTTPRPSPKSRCPRETPLPRWPPATGCATRI